MYIAGLYSLYAVQTMTYLLDQVKLVRGLGCLSAKYALNKCEANVFRTLICEIRDKLTKMFL